MNKLLAALIAMLVAGVVVAFWTRDSQPAKATPDLIAQRSETPQPPTHTHQVEAKERTPAFYETAPDIHTLPPTLSPAIFTGNEKLAYQAAKEIPLTLAQLPCYCHCDASQNHKSLHSCFESEHGENCGICIGEALMAYKLQKQGVAVSEIRKQVIAAYSQR